MLNPLEDHRPTILRSRGKKIKHEQKS
uniref:Uncharacterized protein n=1 Tax=Rhizophora mucronata TaxID=61149 RepID=A0A2P2Q175_RHIMU